MALGSDTVLLPLRLSFLLFFLHILFLFHIPITILLCRMRAAISILGLAIGLHLGLPASLSPILRLGRLPPLPIATSAPPPLITPAPATPITATASPLATPRPAP